MDPPIKNPYAQGSNQYRKQDPKIIVDIQRWSLTHVLTEFIFLVCPIWLPVFFLFFYNEPELGVGIDPGMALTPLPSSIGLDGDRTHDLLIVSQVLYR